MKNKLYFLCISIICISSGCKHEWTLRDSVVYPYFSTWEPLYAIKLKTWHQTVPKEEEDSCYIITSTPSLYNQLNMQLLEPDEFANRLYDIVKKDEALSVTEDFFNCKSNSKIQIDSNIYILYKNDGIEAILDRYTDQKGNLYVYNPFPLEGQERMNFGQDVNIDYIIYLAQQHNIFSFFRDSEGIFHIYVTRYK